MQPGNFNKKNDKSKLKSIPNGGVNFLYKMIFQNSIYLATLANEFFNASYI
jgi:hypothetical protein